MPFTPKRNSTAKEVLIALGYLAGGSEVGTISIYSEADGVPGTALRTSKPAGRLALPTGRP